MLYRLLMLALIASFSGVAPALAEDAAPPEAPEAPEAPQAPQAPEVVTELAPAEDVASEPDVSYALGYMIGTDVASQNIEVDSDRFLAGFRAATGQGEEELTQEQLQAAVMAFQMQMQQKQMQRMAEMQALGAANAAAGQAFLDENSVKEGVVTTESGLQYKILEAGEGDTPAEGNIITVHYEGKLLDGTVFDSSFERGEPMTWDPSQFPLIPGWVEGLKLMNTGATFEFYIPAALAYGEKGNGRIPPNSTLTFKVKLLEFQAPAPGTTEATEGHEGHNH